MYNLPLDAWIEILGNLVDAYSSYISLPLQSLFLGGSYSRHSLIVLTSSPA